MPPQHSFEPLRVDGCLDPYTSGMGECCVKLLRHPILVFQAVFGDLAGRGVQHGDLLEARVKITTYNIHRSAPFLRALVYKEQPSLLARREPTTLSNQLP